MRCDLVAELLNGAMEVNEVVERRRAAEEPTTHTRPDGSIVRRIRTWDDLVAAGGR